MWENKASLPPPIKQQKIGRLVANSTLHYLALVQFKTYCTFPYKNLMITQDRKNYTRLTRRALVGTQALSSPVQADPGCLTLLGVRLQVLTTGVIVAAPTFVAQTDKWCGIHYHVTLYNNGTVFSQNYMQTKRLNMGSAFQSVCCFIYINRVFYYFVITE